MYIAVMFGAYTFPSDFFATKLTQVPGLVPQFMF